MKTKLFIVACSLLSTVAIAQSTQPKETLEDGNRDSKGNLVRGPYETNRFFDNTFIQAGVGAGIYLGNQNANFGARITPTYDLAIGKWLTPSVGLRVQLSFSTAREYSSSYTSSFGMGTYLQKFNMLNLHGDVMWNLSTAIAGYKESRVYEVIPYIGAGWVNTFYHDRPTSNQLAMSFGIINKFRVTPTIDINLELRSTYANGNLDLSTINNRVDIPVAATAGVTIRFGRKNFKRVVKPDYTPYENRIMKLENTTSELNNANEKLAKELAAEKARVIPAPVPVEVKTSSIEVTPVALFFSIGKATLDAKELVNLDFYVNNAIKKDPKKVFTLTGYADKATGNTEINQRLSRQRVDYVYNLLVTKYGVAKDRLVTKSAGDENNPFKLAELNRVVIID